MQPWVENHLNDTESTVVACGYSQKIIESSTIHLFSFTIQTVNSLSKNCHFSLVLLKFEWGRTIPVETLPLIRNIPDNTVSAA